MPLRSVKVAEPFESGCEGMLPKAYVRGGHMYWAARSIADGLSSFLSWALMESYLLLYYKWQRARLLHAYIIVQSQLVFNRFFYFYMEILRFLVISERIC